MSNPNGKPDNQHYIPRFYQRYWDVGEKRVYRYRKANNKLYPSPVSIRYNCSAHRVYEPDKNFPCYYFEDSYGKIESRFATKYRAMLERIAPESYAQLSGADKRLICAMALNLLYRHPTMVYDDALSQRIIKQFQSTSDKTPESKYESRYLSNHLALLNSSDFDPGSFSVRVFDVGGGQVLFSSPLCLHGSDMYFALNPDMYAVISVLQSADDLTITRGQTPWKLYQCYCTDERVTDVFSNNMECLKRFQKMYAKYKLTRNPFPETSSN